MATASFRNKEAWLRRLSKIPEQAQLAAAEPLKEGVDELVGMLKRACPDNEFDEHPGQLREKIEANKVAGTHPLYWRVGAWARDRNGKLYGRFVEFGHIFRRFAAHLAGGKVDRFDQARAAPRPFWFPTYRAWKRAGGVRKMHTKVRRRLKALFDGGSLGNG